MSNFVAISRSNGLINEISLLVEDISSVQLGIEAASVLISMRSGQEHRYTFDAPRKAASFYTLLLAEVENSGRTLTTIDVDDFDV